MTLDEFIDELREFKDANDCGDYEVNVMAHIHGTVGVWCEVDGVCGVDKHNKGVVIVVNEKREE